MPVSGFLLSTHQLKKTFLWGYTLLTYPPFFLPIWLSHTLLTHSFTYANLSPPRRQLASVIWNQKPQFPAIKTSCLQKWIALQNAWCYLVDKPKLRWWCSWTDNQSINTLATILDWKVTVLVVVTWCGDLEESAKKTRSYQLILNNSCLSEIDCEWTPCVLWCQRKESILHIVWCSTTGHKCCFETASNCRLLKRRWIKNRFLWKWYLATTANRTKQHFASRVKL